MGAQGNPVVITVNDSPRPPAPDPMTSTLDKLVQAVEGVSDCMGRIENRLSTLEGEATGGPAQPAPLATNTFYDPDEPTFGPASGARPKVRKPKTSEAQEGVVTEVERKKKKRNDKIRCSIFVFCGKM